MMAPDCGRVVRTLLQWASLAFLLILLAVFGALAPRFLSADNLGAILVQASWLSVVALGMNVVLLTAGVDLSAGAVMYLAAVAVGLGLPGFPAWAALLAATLTGTLFGTINGLLVARLGLPAFIVTLSTTFLGRGLALFFSSTHIVYAGPSVAEWGRAAWLGVPTPVWVAAFTTLCAWLLLNRSQFGPYVRSIGADVPAARAVGVPVMAVTVATYMLCGALAGLGGFISLAQTSAASGAFGENAEFLAIAAAVLGGTSLFGGRGSVWAPVIGAVLVITVQNGLAMLNANPYAYPVVTGFVIGFAALLDSARRGALQRLSQRVRAVS